MRHERARERRDAWRVAALTMMPPTELRALLADAGNSAAVGAGGGGVRDHGGAGPARPHAAGGRGRAARSARGLRLFLRGGEPGRCEAQERDRGAAAMRWAGAWRRALPMRRAGIPALRRTRAMGLGAVQYRPSSARRERSVQPRCGSRMVPARRGAGPCARDEFAGAQVLKGWGLPTRSRPRRGCGTAARRKAAISAGPTTTRRSYCSGGLHRRRASLVRARLGWRAQTDPSQYDCRPLLTSGTGIARAGESSGPTGQTSSRSSGRATSA